ncbi:MAG: glutamate racemase [Candidatus Moraniibacteriota bacterium]
MKNNNGKIGIFDSGLGGLTILKEVIAQLPEREYLYLGDNLRAPYGDRTQKKIFEYTLAGVEWLFSHGAEIVILACNTASANALRKIQQEVLPFKYANKKVLGIIIPTAEELSKFSLSKHIGVLATVATVASGSFEREAKKYNPKIKLSIQSGGKLAELIEQNKDKKKLETEIEMVIGRLMAKDKLIDTIVLGCTHYALIEEQIKESLPSGIRIISQGEIVAKKLAEYLNRHAEIDQRLSNRFAVDFYTTAIDDTAKKKMAQFFGKEISVATVDLNRH